MGNDNKRAIRSLGVQRIVAWLGFRERACFAVTVVRRRIQACGRRVFGLDFRLQWRVTFETPPFLLPHECPTLLNSLPTSWQPANSAHWSARVIRFGLSGGMGWNSYWPRLWSWGEFIGTWSLTRPFSQPVPIKRVLAPSRPLRSGSSFKTHSPHAFYFALSFLFSQQSHLARDADSTSCWIGLRSACRLGFELRLGNRRSSRFFEPRE